MKVDKSIYLDEEWQTLRIQRLLFDDDICVDCGGFANHVHHLKYPAHDLRDCVSLCEECHLRRHKRVKWY